MRILHTSDWHLGKTLHGLDLLPFQQNFITELVSQVDELDVDCVIVAGDVFDKAIPSIDAVKLFSDALTQLADRCAVVVTSGNHDSAVRLGAGSALYRTGVHIATDPTAVTGQLDMHVDGVHVRFYPIPFLDPDHCRYLFGSEDQPLARSHQAVMDAVVEQLWQRDATLAITPHARIAVAHAFVAGGQRSDSERDLSVGGVETVVASTFSRFDYVALGHLHGPQRAGADHIRYSGSPLRYSFSEQMHSKSMVVVDVDCSGVTAIDTIPITQPREMVTLEGSLSEVTDPHVVNVHSDAWVKAVITDNVRPPDLVAAIKSAYPQALSIIHTPTHQPIENLVGPTTVDLRDPVTVTQDFLQDVTSVPASRSEVRVIRNAYDAARRRESV